MLDQHANKVLSDKHVEEGDNYDWPITDFSQPYKIQTEDWTPKSREERQQDLDYATLSKDAVIFKGDPNLSGPIL